MKFHNLFEMCYRVGLLKDIRKMIVLLQNNVSFKIGNGKSTKFWEDPWCSELSLCLSFPTHYAMVGLKKSLLGDLWVNGNWDFKFGRAFNDWELEII